MKSNYYSNRGRRKRATSSEGESLSELRLKVLNAEDQLISEKIKLHSLKNKYEELREQWNEEIKRTEDIVTNLRENVSVKENLLEKAKEELQDVYAKFGELEAEIEREENEKKRLEKENEEKRNANVEDIRLGRELMALKQMKKELLLSMEWVEDFRRMEELEVKEKKSKTNVAEDFKEVWKEIENQMKLQDQTMREIDEMSLSGQRQELEDLLKMRAHLEEDCKNIEEMKKELEKRTVHVEGKE